MLTIVLPLVGAPRPRNAPAIGPEPLASEYGAGLVDTLMHTLPPRQARRLILVAGRDDLHTSLLAAIERAPGYAIEGVDGASHDPTRALRDARHLLDGHDPLVVAACDRWIDLDPDTYVAHMDEAGADGLILTMPSDDPEAAIVRQDALGWATRIVDHHGPSDDAVAGVCVFRREKDFIRAADALIADAAPGSSPVSMASVYTVLIEEGARISVWPAHQWASEVYDLRRASDLQRLRARAHARHAVAA